MQVIAGYVATAGIVVLILVIYYVFAFRYDLDPFRKTSKKDGDQKADQKADPPNPVDSLVYEKLHLRSANTDLSTRDHWDELLTKVCINAYVSSEALVYVLLLKH